MRQSISTLFVSLLSSLRAALRSTQRANLSAVITAASLLAAFPGMSFAQAYTPLVTAAAGSGTNESYFVVNFDDGPSGTNNPASNFVFGYLWSDPASNEYEMIQALSSVGLQSTLTYYPTGPNWPYPSDYSLDSLTYGSEAAGNSAGWDPVTGSYWTAYQSTTSLDPTDPNSWTFASTGPLEVTLTNGGVYSDAWENSGDTPVVPEVAAAPEVGTWSGLLCGMIVLTVLGIASKRYRSVH